MTEMLRQIGGNYRPDFGEREVMSFDEPEKTVKNNTLNFISDMVLNTK